MSLTNGVITVLPPPAGYIVDFDNPARNGDIAAYWVIGIGNVLAFLFIAQRVYVKAIVRRNFGLDDVCLLTAWAFSCAIQTLITRGFALKFIGVHAWEMPITKFQDFVRDATYLYPIIYAPPTALAKLVILLFYVQIQNQQKWFRWSVYGAIFINVGSNLGIMISSIFSCNPIRAGWDITITDAMCIKRPALFQATAALGVIVDVLIILIPIPMVLGLHLSKAKKAGLLVTFTIGSATVVTSIVRLVLLTTALDDIDQPWGGGPICVWICVEANLLVMCAALPTIRLFIKTIAPSLMSSTSRPSYNASGNALSGSKHHKLASSARGADSSARSVNRKHYGRFDDEARDNGEYGMTTFVHNDRGQGTKQPVVTSNVEASSNASKEFGEDDSSERGIIQTRTTQITYSTSPPV